MSKENINKKKYVVFEMVKILKEHTDRLHPMKQKELVERLHEAGYTTDRSTVRRTMTDLVLDESSHVRSAANAIHDEKDCLNDTYYSGLYYEQDFSPAELRWLIDGILFSRNVPHDRRDELIGKLTRLGNRHFRKNMSMARIRRLSGDEPMNEQLFDNIDLIGRAIEEKKKITTIYGYLGPDFTLEPSRGSANGPQLLSPYAMVVRNGFYFLICNNDRHDDMTHYRLDRMTEVKITDLPVRPVRELQGFRAGWDLQEYMKHNINMAFGTPERITFIAEPKAVREIIDAFGRGASFTRRPDGNLDCVVYVPEYDMERWVLQFGDLVTVTGPDTLLEKLKQYSEILAKKYAGS